MQYIQLSEKHRRQWKLRPLSSILNEPITNSTLKWCRKSRLVNEPLFIFVLAQCCQELSVVIVSRIQ